jgi:hypothetical protein
MRVELERQPNLVQPTRLKAAMRFSVSPTPEEQLV